jgi:hypothetical protein
LIRDRPAEAAERAVQNSIAGKACTACPIGGRAICCLPRSGTSARRVPTGDSYGAGTRSRGFKNEPYLRPLWAAVSTNRSNPSEWRWLVGCGGCATCADNIRRKCAFFQVEETNWINRATSGPRAFTKQGQGSVKGTTADEVCCIRAQDGRWTCWHPFGRTDGAASYKRCLTRNVL